MRVIMTRREGLLKLACRGLVEQPHGGFPADGTGGVSRIDVGATCVAYDLRRQSDGRLVFSGYTTATDNLWRGGLRGTAPSSVDSVGVEHQAAVAS